MYTFDNMNTVAVVSNISITFTAAVINQITNPVTFTAPVGTTTKGTLKTLNNAVFGSFLGV